MNALQLASSFQEPGKVTLYNVVLFLHIAGAIAAFGVTFAYPIIFSRLQRVDPRNLAWFHQRQEIIGKFLITGGATLTLLSGIYMVAASDAYSFSKPWIGVAFLGLIVILGLGGGFFAPRERRLAELATRDAEAGGSGEVTLSAEYIQLAAKVDLVGKLVSALVLLILFLMVIKPGQ